MVQGEKRQCDDEELHEDGQIPSVELASVAPVQVVLQREDVLEVKDVPVPVVGAAVNCRHHKRDRQTQHNK